MTTCCELPCNACFKGKNQPKKPALLVAMVGNPNGGKTTLFNALTGANQQIGNRPGVTVECTSGFFTFSSVIVEVVDLPGIYSLAMPTGLSAMDERITAEFLAHQADKIDVIINVVDACHLERHLYLTTQLLESGAAVVLALNMMDVARAQQIHIDVAKLSQELGCPVVALEANKGTGAFELKQALIAYQRREKSFSQARSKWNEPLTSGLLAEGTSSREATEVQLAAARYHYIQTVLQSCLTHSVQAKTSWTSRIDAIVLDRWLGIPIFFATMYLLFFFTIGMGGKLQDFFDSTSQLIFVDGLSYGLTQLGAPPWLIALFANGVGKGINTVMTFIPVLGCMFLFLALLEDSGYMTRAAFVVDRFMRALGLPGKALVPMIVGFGCNVPAVMGARTLENRRDRILTIMMIPFMSCGARLAIFTVFTAAFFPHGGQNIVFVLYLIGIAMAIVTGYFLRNTVLKGGPSPLIMELPRYHVPHWQTLFLHAWQRLKGFVFRAGKLIVPICILIGLLNALNVDGSINIGEGGAHSILSLLGRKVTPLFAPMGIQADNWPATVGLVTGILAKEVVVGTLNTLYSQAGHVIASPGMYGAMYHHFDGKVGAFAYLLFVLLYFPCISTMAVMTRELHRGWAIFSAVWMTGTAYGAAVIFYQGATFFHHPVYSILWISAVLAAFLITVALIRWIAAKEWTIVKWSSLTKSSLTKSSLTKSNAKHGQAQHS